MPKVSVNLVTWNGERFIEDCLFSVLAQTFTDFSIVIIDNGSTDRTVELINERFPHLKVVQHKNNLGFAKAHNQAIHWSRSEYVICLNQDVILEPDFLARLVEFMDAHPEAGSVTGKIFRWQDKEKTRYIDSLGLAIQRNYRVSDIAAGKVDEGQFDRPSQVFGASGCVPFYRRSALETVMFSNEYFDESFFSYKEDIDLAHRLFSAGWAAWFVPAAVAYHSRTIGAKPGRQNLKQLYAERRRRNRRANYWSYRNHWYFILKNLPKFNWHFLAPVLGYEMGKFLFTLFFETANLRAFIDLLSHRRELASKRAFILKNRKVNAEALDLVWSKKVEAKN